MEATLPLAGRGVILSPDQTCISIYRSLDDNATAIARKYLTSAGIQPELIRKKPPRERLIFDIATLLSNTGFNIIVLNLESRLCIRFLSRQSSLNRRFERKLMIELFIVRSRKIAIKRMPELRAALRH